MALSKIKLANKKAKYEARRKAKNLAHKKHVAETNIRNKRTRRMMVEGRRQDLKQRESATNYVKQLEAEIEGN